MSKTNSTLIMFMVIVSSMAAPLSADEAASAEYLNSGKVFPAGIPLSEAVRVGDTLYLSGQVGIVPGTMNLAPGGLEGETRQTMENIKTSLEAHGYSHGRRRQVPGHAGGCIPMGNVQRDLQNLV